ncbi:hypothetical protein B0E53_06857 [Micromonospora sp. MH33]|nr:hypothetical protein B0E53_06857 [Micromonospora sp. MH33]
MRGDAGDGHQPGDVPALLRQDQGDHGAGLPRPGGPPAPVQVVLRLGRRVGVDHQVQPVHVDAPGRHVGGHQRGDVPGAELLQDPGALRLALAAVQRRGAYPLGEQLAGDPVGAVLGRHEQDGAALAGGDVGQCGGLVVRLDVQHVVGHRGHRGGARVNGVRHGVAQEAADQPVHAPVQGGREEHPLAVRVDLLQQLRHLRQEAHVGHLVGLVEHGDGHLVEPGVAAVDQVVQPARGGHQHLGAGAQRVRLPLEGEPPDHGGAAQPERPGVRGERRGDLLGQFAGGYQHQRQRAAGAGPATGRAVQQRQPEGQRLARAGAPAAEHVPAGQRVRQGRRLDRERLGDALRGQLGDQLRGQAGGGEGGNGHGHAKSLPRRGTCRGRAPGSGASPGSPVVTSTNRKGTGRPAAARHVPRSGWAAQRTGPSPRPGGAMGVTG